MATEQRTLTVEEVVNETIRILGGIQIPAEVMARAPILLERICVPITQAIWNLQECSRVMEISRKAAEIAAEPPREAGKGPAEGTEEEQATQKEEAAEEAVKEGKDDE